MSERRTVLKVIAGVAGAVTAGVAVVPAAGLVAAPARTASPLAARGGTDGWSAVARFDDLEVGRYVQVPIIGSEVDAWTASPDRRLGAVWLLRGGEGADTLRALSAVCPHLGCLIDRQGDGFNCPCHVSSFASDGRALEGPSPRGMDPLEVRVHEGNVMVRWARFRLGTPDRVKEG
jgi:menaquinol-cytochrome c reductase iron-sulfur subunit